VTNEEPFDTKGVEDKAKNNGGTIAVKYKGLRCMNDLLLPTLHLSTKLMQESIR
jgi:hypothetical protein